MRIAKVFLLLITIASSCFLLFTMGKMLSGSNRIVWYNYAFEFVAFTVVILNFIYHLKSIRYYGDENSKKGIEKFSKLLLLAPLLFSSFFLWLVGEISMFLLGKIEMGMFQHYLSDVFIAIVFMVIGVAGIVEVSTFYKKLQQETIEMDEIDNIGTSNV